MKIKEISCKVFYSKDTLPRIQGMNRERERESMHDFKFTMMIYRHSFYQNS